MGRRPFLACAARAAAAAAASWPAPALAASRCALQLLADIPLRDTAGFLSVAVEIDGAPVSLIVDTGADAGLLAPEFVRALALPLAPSSRAHLTGTGGAGGDVPIAIINRLALGPSLILRDVPVPVGALPSLPRITPAVAGLIGGDLLRHFDVEIDPAAGRLRLYDAGAAASLCRNIPPWPGAFATIPLTARGNRVTLQALLDGHPVTALLDSGARSRIVSRQAALAAGVPGPVLDAEPGGITSGVDMHDQIYHWHRFRTLEIGGETARNPVLTVAPLADGLDMLLGSDWFARHRVWISYATGHIFAQSLATKDPG